MIAEDISLDADLTAALKEALERKGVIKEVKARLRAAAFNCLEEKSAPLPTQKSRDLFISTELIKEFLVSLNLVNTLSVLCEELGQDSEGTSDRNFIAGELGFNSSTTNREDSAAAIPLLTLLVQQSRLQKDSYAQDNTHTNREGS